MQFEPIDWDKPLHVGPELAAIPEGARIKGIFLAALAKTARAHGVKSELLRPRYSNDEFYPLREHVQLLAAVTHARYPKLGLRRGLRKLGRAAVAAYLDSMLGRVTLGTTHDPELTLRMIADSYPINIPGARAAVDEYRSGEAVVSLHDVPYFLDCHHVGFFEKALRRCGATATVEIAIHGRFSASYRCRW